VIVYEVAFLDDKNNHQSKHLLFLDLSYLRHDVNVVLDSGHVVSYTGSVHVNFTLDLLCIAVERRPLEDRAKLGADS